MLESNRETEIGRRPKHSKRVVPPRSALGERDPNVQLHNVKSRLRSILSKSNKMTLNLRAVDLQLLLIFIGLSNVVAGSSSSGDHRYTVGDDVPLFVNKLGPFTNPRYLTVNSLHVEFSSIILSFF